MAIARDTSSIGTLVNPGTSQTWSHTCTGSNLILFVACFGNTGAAGDISGVTYNGVSMTQLSSSPVQDPGSRWLYLFYLLNPATGANNVVISASASIAIEGTAASYTGVKQSSQPDATISNTASGATYITTSITTVAANCWIFTAAKSSTGTMTSGTNATVLQQASQVGIFDSNAAIASPGPTNVTVNTVTAQTAVILASFSPVVVAPSGNSNFLSFM